jgi:hypothetical protein
MCSTVRLRREGGDRLQNLSEILLYQTNSPIFVVGIAYCALGLKNHPCNLRLAPPVLFLARAG